MLEYDSDSSNGGSGDAFQISKITAAKRPRTGDLRPPSVALSAAPDVLSEVGTLTKEFLNYFISLAMVFFLGSPKAEYVSCCLYLPVLFLCCFIASLVTRPTDTQMNVNIGYEDMSKPVLGPENPFGDRKFLNQNTISGMWFVSISRLFNLFILS